MIQILGPKKSVLTKEIVPLFLSGAVALRWSPPGFSLEVLCARENQFMQV